MLEMQDYYTGASYSSLSEDSGYQMETMVIQFRVPIEMHCAIVSN